MDAEEVELVGSLLRGQLGESIRWRFYDRTLRSPLNFVLERAEQQLNRQFQVCWVDNAPPDIFVLRGLSQPLVVYSTRYVEIWADIRGLVTSDMWGDGLLERIAAADCLGLIAEFSLEENDPELAGSAIIESILRKEGIFRTPNSIDSLEHETISFGYIATWFYGLCHELGHLRDYDTPLFKDDWIVAAVESALQDGSVPPAIREEAISRIRSGDTSFLLHPGNLRSEGLADVFAASVFLQTMHDLVSESNTSADRIDFAGSLVAELLLSLNIIAVFERCRRVAHHSSVGFPPRAREIDAVLHPTLVAVRMKFMLWFQRHAVAAYLFGDHPRERQLAAVDTLIDGALRPIRPNLERFETGMNAAVAFAADREHRVTFLEQLGKLAHHPRKSEQPFDRITIEQFVARAHSLGRHSPQFDALLARVRNPETATMPDVSGHRGFLCAWIVGPDGYNSPFGLQTRYGFLIFAFAPGSKVYERFAEESKADLAKGFELTSTMIVAETDKALREALAKHLPIGSEFIVVVEGTTDFDTYIRELAAGTIWPDSTN